MKGYAQNIVEIIDEFADGPVIFVGHSFSAMVEVIAANMRPDLISAHVVVGPSPSYINDGEYFGGPAEKISTRFWKIPKATI